MPRDRERSENVARRASASVLASCCDASRRRAGSPRTRRFAFAGERLARASMARQAIVLWRNARLLRGRCRLARPQKRRTPAKSDRQAVGNQVRPRAPLASTAPAPGGRALPSARYSVRVRSKHRLCTERFEVARKPAESVAITSRIVRTRTNCRAFGRSLESLRPPRQRREIVRVRMNEPQRLRPKLRTPYVRDASAGKSSVHERTNRRPVRPGAAIRGVPGGGEGRRGFARGVWKGNDAPVSVRVVAAAARDGGDRCPAVRRPPGLARSEAAAHVRLRWWKREAV